MRGMGQGCPKCQRVSPAVPGLVNLVWAKIHLGEPCRKTPAAVAGFAFLLAGKLLKYCGNLWEIGALCFVSRALAVWTGWLPNPSGAEGVNDLV